MTKENQLTTVNQNLNVSLTDLWQEVNALLPEIEQAKAEVDTVTMRCIDKAYLLGEKLLEIQARCAHGEFLDELEKNFAWSVKTAYTYMRAAKLKQSLNASNLPEPKSIRQALKALDLLAEPAPPAADNSTRKLQSSPGAIIEAEVVTEHVCPKCGWKF